jgi:hypothetical protein
VYVILCKHCLCFICDLLQLYKVNRHEDVLKTSVENMALYIEINVS